VYEDGCRLGCCTIYSFVGTGISQMLTVSITMAMMEATSSFEMSVNIYQPAPCNIQEVGLYFSDYTS
jgi:hypothetical protein